MGAKHFGARVTRLEDPALLSGRGRFVDDVKLPGVLHACFVRSPYAHARSARHRRQAGAGDARRPRRPRRRRSAGSDAQRSDADAAAESGDHGAAHPACAGARRGLLRRPAGRGGDRRQPLHRRGCRGRGRRSITTRCRRSATAATRSRTARRGRTPRSAPMCSSTFQLAYGDVDAAFANAPHVFEDELWQHRGGGMAIETRAVLASHDAATDMLTVWSGTQTPHIGRRMLADLLGRELESIRMIAPDVGGGFGPKAIFYPEEAVIPAAALKLGRPVKWIEDRREHFLCATQERDQYWNVAIAVDAEAKILGLARPDAARHRRLRAVGHHHALHRRGDRAGPLCDPGLSARHHGGAHQQGADHAGARRRPAAGGVRHGAVAGPRRPRTAARSRRGARGATSSSPSRCPTRSG